MTNIHPAQHHDPNIIHEKRHKVLVEFPVKHKPTLNGKAHPSVIKVEAAIANYFGLKHYEHTFAEKTVTIHKKDKTIQYVTGHTPTNRTAKFFFAKPVTIPGYHKKHAGGDVPQNSVTIPMATGMQIPDLIALAKKHTDIAYLKVDGRKFDIRHQVKPTAE